MEHPRLRQLVVVATEVEPVSSELRELLGTPGYHDEGVAEFGLANAVHGAGSDVVEVVAPVQDGTTAGRQLDRHGPGGYMAMFEVADVATARQRLDELGVRVAWEIALPGVVDLHLHPKDVPGAIVALDQVQPAGSWPWAGPQWQPGPGGLTELVVAVEKPEQACARWAAVLGVPSAGDVLHLPAARQAVRFVAVRRRPGIVAATLSLPRPPATVELAGVELHVEALP